MLSELRASLCAVVRAFMCAVLRTVVLPFLRAGVRALPLSTVVGQFESG